MPKCKAYTQKGGKCKNNANNAGGTCGVHKRRKPKTTGGNPFAKKKPNVEAMLQKYGQYLSPKEQSFIRKYGVNLNTKDLKNFIDGCKRVSGIHRQACLQKHCNDYDCLEEATELAYQ